MKYKIGDLVFFETCIFRNPSLLFQSIPQRPKLCQRPVFPCEIEDAEVPLLKTFFVILKKYNAPEVFNIGTPYTNNDNCYVCNSQLDNQNYLLYENEIRILEN